MADWMVSLIVALITAVFSFAGVYISNRKSQALVEYRLEQLEQKVDKHNNLVERMYRVEGKIEEATHEIEDLKKRA